MARNYDERELTYEIVEEIGIISTQSTGWTREINMVSWNGGQAKYDIREWSPLHDKMGRGATFNEQEMRTLMDLLRRRTRYVPRGVNMVQNGRSEASRQVSGSVHTEETAGPASDRTGDVPPPDDDRAWNREADRESLSVEEEEVLTADESAEEEGSVPAEEIDEEKSPF